MLYELFKKYHANKEIEHGLLYDELFSPYKDSDIAVLEIGIQTGRSLKAFGDYFTKARIFGIDKLGNFPEGVGRAITFEGNVLNGKFMANTIGRIGKIDIIIDDGAHTPDTQQAAFTALFPVCQKFYIIEDLHAMLLPGYYRKGYVVTENFLKQNHIPVKYHRCHNYNKDIGVITK